MSFINNLLLSFFGLSFSLVFLFMVPDKYREEMKSILKFLLKVPIVNRY